MSYESKMKTRVRKACLTAVDKTRFGKKGSDILVFRSSALGDFVISMPAIKLIRDLFPDNRIILVTIQSAGKEMRDKVTGYTIGGDKFPWTKFADKILDEIIVLDNLNAKTLFCNIRPKIKSLNAKYCFLLTDPCAPFMGILKKMVLFRVLGFEGKFFGWRDIGDLNGDKKLQFEEGYFKHHVLGSVESVLECPEAYHKKQVCVNFQLDIKKIEKDLAQEFWIENNLDNKRVVVIAPGSVQPHKKWPVEKYKKIVMSLLEDDQIRIVISGTKNDKAIGEEIHSCNPDKIIDLTGNTSVQELAAILEKTDLLIGNDGGTMHLGDAVGTNVISIVPGLEYPNSIEPFHNIKNSLRHYTECYPCYSFMSCPNGHNKCMLDISVQDVMNKAKDILYNGENLRAPFNGRIFKVDRKKGSIRFSEINI